jgi:hypothetical protein
MAQYFQTGSDGSATSNFDAGGTNQGNSFFLPSIYSKKVLNFFRKASVVEAITNTDYAGEISAYGDSVKIIKEPVISVSDYTRGKTDVTQTLLTDQEITLVVDSAKAFKFIVDDIETNMSHVNFKEVASSSAAYALKDSYDAAVLSTMLAGVSASSPDHVIGADAAAGSAGVGETTASVDLGVASEVDPLDLMARMARLLDDESVPEENRWFVAGPDFYEELSQSGSKLLSVDFNAGQGSIRNGLVSSGKLRGFDMYKSNNMGNGDLTTADGQCLGGHISSTATANTILSTEVIRDPSSFGDIVRGLHVYGAKVLRPEALVKAYYTID